MYSIGIDSGSSTTKGVLLKDHMIIEKIILPTGVNPRRTINDVYKKLHRKDAVVITTGYGRHLLEEATKSITEITCHGIGAAFIHPEIQAVIDIGGQDSKVILLDEKQQVKDFLMNDKCAAGTGRFMEVISRTLQEDLLDLDAYVKNATSTKISSMCAVFAESEVISLLASDVPGPSIALGVVEAIAVRTASFAKRLPLSGKVFFSGGLAQLTCFQDALKKHLELDIVTHKDAQLIGAIGAAILGNRYRK